jgi:hypothetical protein
MRRAFTSHGFHTTVDWEPLFSTRMVRCRPGSSMTTALFVPMNTLSVSPLNISGSRPQARSTPATLSK